MGELEEERDFRVRVSSSPFSSIIYADGGTQGQNCPLTSRAPHVRSPQTVSQLRLFSGFSASFELQG